MIKAICDKPTADIESVFSKIRIKTRMPLSPLLFRLVLEVATAIRQEKEGKGIQIGKEDVKLTICKAEREEVGR